MTLFVMPFIIKQRSQFLLKLKNKFKLPSSTPTPAPEEEKEAGYAMVYVAKMMLDGKEIVDGMEIPNIGKGELDGTTLKFDRPMGLTTDNVDDYDF